MKQKSIDQYFVSARQLPLAMSLEEVQALVKIKGTTSINQHQSWWNLKNFIFMTTSILITTTVLLFSLSDDSSSTFSSIEKKEKTIDNNFNESIKPIYREKKTANKIYNNPQKIESVESKKNVTFLIEEKNQESPIQNIPSFDFNNAFLPLLKSDSVSESSKNHTKVISDELSANGINMTKAILSRGNITVEVWDKPVVQLTANIDIENDNAEEKQLLLDNIKIEMKVERDIITIENECVKGDDCLCNCSTTTIRGKKKNRKVKKSNSKIKIDYVLRVPRNMNLDLNSSYGDITIPTMNADLTIKSFQGNFYGNEIDGKLNLNSRYGKVEVASFNSGSITLFQSKGSIGNSNDMDLNSKYSQLIIKSVQELKLEAFQSNIEILEATNEIKGSFKYGDLKLVKNATNVKLNIFQSKINAKSIQKFNYEGSYTSVKSDQIDDLILVKSFQDNFEIGTLKSIKGDAKYTSFTFKELSDVLILTTFQGSIKIANVSADFKDLNIDSKYTGIDLNFNSGAKYNLNANTTYTSFSYPEQEMEVTHHNTALNKNDVKGVFNAKSNKPTSLVSLVCFQGKVTIN